MWCTIGVVETGLLQSVVQGGSFGLLSFVVLWAFIRGIPAAAAQFTKMQDNFSATLKEQRQDFRSVLDEIRGEHKDERQQWAEVLEGHAKSIEQNTMAIDRQREQCRNAKD